jgi:type IV pilus assembly protein PilO
MNLQLSDLDLTNIARWPAAARAVIILSIMGGVMFLGYWFHTKEQLVELETVEQRENDLRIIFEKKAQQAANLEAYEQQLEEMRESFGAMLRQLPNKTEVADLLVDVSQTGLAAGLEFELFNPQNEIPKDFYAELPIKIRVIGNYHEFGNFVSGVAALPRIVTVNDITISPNAKSSDLLAMDLTAKTYRYMEEDERAPEDETPKKKGKKGKGKKK